jgi:hypothetical protein
MFNRLRRKDFWLTGLVLAVAISAACLVYVGIQIRQFSDAERHAEQQARLAHPDLAWAFDEWQRCGNGSADYARKGFVTKAQCDLAVINLGKQRGVEITVRNALADRQAILERLTRN